jgi:hypothetical protein
MFDYRTESHGSRRKPPISPITGSASLLASALLAAGLTAGVPGQDARAANGDENEIPFKVAKIYFETNGSKCDMGIQIVFDTEGIVKGKFKNPNERVIHVVRARNGLSDIGGQTEGFLESVEPVIAELAEATNATCEPDPEDLPDAITLDDIRHFFPAGFYEFEGITADGTELDDEAELTYDVPDGPVLKSPDGKVGVNPNRSVKIKWEPVTMTIPGLLPNDAQAPVDIVGYQVLVYDGNAGESPQEFNVTVPGTETSVTVPRQFLQPNTEYKIEVLAIEVSGNQTITEGEFSTGP